MNPVQDQPLLSVCIPYYRGEAFIARCLGSVHSQVIDGQACAVERGLIEIIITSDDNSPVARDLLGRLATCFGAQVYFNEPGLGLTGNWQAALQRGRGQFVTLLHQDDWYHPDGLDHVLRTFRDNPDRVFVATNAVLVGHQVAQHLTDPPRDLTGVEAVRDLDAHGLVYAPSVVFFRRSALDGIPVLYSEAYQWSPERELYRLIGNNHPQGIFSYVPRPVVARGMGDGRFSVNNEDLRLLDILTYMQRQAPDDPQERATFLAATRDGLGERLKLLTRTTRVGNPGLLKRTQEILARVLADPRMVEVYRDTPETLVDHLAAGAKATPNASYFAVDTAVTVGLPQRLGRPELLDRLLVGNPEDRERMVERVPRILDSAEFHRPVIICGFHHSGTRLLAAALDAIGLFQYVNSPTHEWSYFQVINTLMLPQWMDPPAIAAYRGEGAEEIDLPRIARRLSAGGYLGHGPWGQKDPRNSVTVDAWLRMFPRARIVNIVRDPLDVLGTLPADYAPFSPGNKRPQEEPEFWAELWLAYLNKTRDAMNRAAHAVEVRFEDLCSAPGSTLETIVAALDLDCDVLPRDLTYLGIKPSRVGVYREWLEDGRLPQQSLDILIQRVGKALDVPFVPHAGKH